LRWLALLFLLSGLAAAEEGDHYTVRLEWEPGLAGSNVLRHYPLVPTPPAGVPVPDLGEGRFAALALGYKSVDTVFLLSDGMPNEGRYEHPDNILLALRQLNQTRRIAIHTVAIGTDSQLLRRIASGNSGVYVRR
jgi:hypothetical protein